MDFLSVSWTDLQEKTFLLAKKVGAESRKPDLIVAIARGGVTIAHILSDFLHLPITTFTISSYKDLKQQSVPKITLNLGDKLHKRNILLVDDVSDTGKTFVRGMAYLRDLGAEHITTAAVFTKPWTTFLPDHHVAEVKEWIMFPYDIRETIEALNSKLSREGKSKEEITNILKGLKIAPQYIRTYLT